jgi:hypothetical protein
MAVNVKEDGAIELLVDDMVLEDLIVESLGCPLGGRHFEFLSRIAGIGFDVESQRLIHK